MSHLLYQLLLQLLFPCVHLFFLLLFSFKKLLKVLSFLKKRSEQHILHIGNYNFVESKWIRFWLQTCRSLISCITCWFSGKELTPRLGISCLALHMGQTMIFRPSQCFWRFSRHFTQSVCEHGKIFGFWYSSKHTSHSVKSVIFRFKRLSFTSKVANDLYSFTQDHAPQYLPLYLML